MPILRLRLPLLPVIVATSHEVRVWRYVDELSPAVTLQQGFNVKVGNHITPSLYESKSVEGIINGQLVQIQAREQLDCIGEVVHMAEFGTRGAMQGERERRHADVTEVSDMVLVHAHQSFNERFCAVEMEECFLRE